MSLYGIDVSGYQRDMDEISVFKQVDFAIMKATEGTSVVDSCCDRFYQAAKRADILRGFYHVLTAADPVAQADHYVDSCLGYFGDGIPVLDVEGTGVYPNDPDMACRFFDRVKERTGAVTMLYANGSCLKSADYSPLAERDAGLWIANYYFGYDEASWSDMDADAHMSTPYGFPFAAIWQCTSSGRVAGYGPLDLDIAFMDADAWGRYATASIGSADGGDGDGGSQGDSDGASLVGKTLTVRIESVS